MCSPPSRYKRGNDKDDFHAVTLDCVAMLKCQWYTGRENAHDNGTFKVRIDIKLLDHP